MDGVTAEPQKMFRMPAEWERHEAVWLSWPCSAGLWVGYEYEIQVDFGALARLLARYEPVRVNAGMSHHETIQAYLAGSGEVSQSNVTLYDHPTNDVWCRDHGATFVTKRGGSSADEGSKAIVNWRFDAWGGKYEPYDLDNAVPLRMGECLGLRVYDSPLVCEGGALEVDGRGRLLTTESVLMARNPGMTKGQIEEELRAWLGVERIIWLRQGLQGDDTDGHVDTFARFVPSGEVLLSWPEENDSDAAAMAENEERLEEAGLSVIRLPHPGTVSPPGNWRATVLPATYANFYIGNDCVVFPTYGAPRTEEQVRGILAECFPGREVVPFDCRRILLEGGTVHCLTQQEPSVR